MITVKVTVVYLHIFCCAGISAALQVVGKTPSLVEQQPTTITSRNDHSHINNTNMACNCSSAGGKFFFGLGDRNAAS